MQSNKDYDAETALKKLAIIQKNLDRVKNQITDPDNTNAVQEAKQLIELQREILLANPLLDMDKIVVSKFILDDRARIATTNEMCMPMSNYMGLIDVPPTGYNAEICELSDLQNQSPSERTIYKPTRGEGIADLQLHWDADRMLFATARPVVIDEIGRAHV